MVLILQLPDISNELGVLPIEPGQKVIVVQGGGFIVEKGKSRSIYTRIIRRPPLFAEAPPLEEQPIIVKSFFSTKEIKTTLPQADDCFKHQPANRAMAETNDLLQQMLVTAQQRSEQLRQMEQKSENILAQAKAFAGVGGLIRKRKGRF
jgi:hypothetical protein